MFEDLRNEANFIDDEETPPTEVGTGVMRPALQERKETFLGMTAQQRFILSLMLFFMVCILGVVALVLTGSINLL